MERFDFIEMKLPAKVEYIGVIRLIVSGIANRMGFDFEDIEDIKVAISEAVTNATKHAYSESDNGEVTLGFGIYEDRLEILVADYGGSFSLSDIKKQTGPYRHTETIENLREGGFGLFLIDALMDKVEIMSKRGVVVLMTKELPTNEVGLNDVQISTT